MPNFNALHQKRREGMTKRYEVVITLLDLHQNVLFINDLLH
ncbi:hypothetical protein [Pararhodonellum marinum]|nr:hypothetical protein [Pararhodonellum marinum]